MLDTKIKDTNKPWRNWCFTWITPTIEEINNLKTINADSCKYIIFGHELTQDDKPHIQGYIELNKAQRLTGIKKLLDPVNGKKSTIHVEPAINDRKVNETYCSKGLQSHDEWTKLKDTGLNYGKNANIYKQEFKEFNKGKGKRNDWTELYNRITEEPDFATILSEFPEYAIKYPHGIQKAIDTVLLTEHKNKLNQEMSDLRLYNWETNLIEELQNIPDKRKIIWYVDKIGGCGKTTFAKYLLSKGNCAYFTNAKTADIAHAYQGENTVIFDFTRSIEGRINYEIIEAIKNGIIFAAKYNSGLKVNTTPHIICFSNFDPDQSKLSIDRWDIRILTKDQCSYPKTLETATTAQENHLSDTKIPDNINQNDINTNQYKHSEIYHSNWNDKNILTDVILEQVLKASVEQTTNISNCAGYVGPPAAGRHPTPRAL